MAETSVDIQALLDAPTRLLKNQDRFILLNSVLDNNYSVEFAPVVWAVCELLMSGMSEGLFREVLPKLTNLIAVVRENPNVHPEYTIEAKIDTIISALEELDLSIQGIDARLRKVEQRLRIDTVG